MTDTQPTPDPTAGPAAVDTPPTFQPAPPSPPSPSASGRSEPRRRGFEVLLAVITIFAVAAIAFAVGRSTAPTTIAQAGLRSNGGQYPNLGPLTNGRQFPNGGQLPNGRQFPNGGRVHDGRQMPNGQGGNGRVGGGFGGGFAGSGLGVTLTGQVTEVTADHLTLTLASGQTIQIALDGTTTYHTQTAATAADVTAGSTVQVQVTRGGHGGGNGNGGTVRLGQATSVTVVPK